MLSWLEPKSVGYICRKYSRPMAHRQQPRHEPRVSYRLLRLAWASQVIRWWIAQSDRTAGCGPACPVVWQGRRGDSPPYADVCRACLTAWGCKSPSHPDGGEVIAKRKGVVARLM